MVVISKFNIYDLYNSENVILMLDVAFIFNKYLN